MSRLGRMMLLNSGGRKMKIEYEDEGRRRDYEDADRRDRSYDVDNRFRDNQGREHYNNGRYAPQNTMPYYYPPYGGYPEMRTTRPIGFERGSEPTMGGADATVPHYNEMERMPGNRAISGGAESRTEPPFNMQIAQEWMRGMQNEDGTTGPHWSMEQTNKIMEQRAVNEDPVKFWAAMNMIYSDFINVAKHLGVSNIDFYVEMAKAFLDDKDVSGDKMGKYYAYVVK